MEAGSEELLVVGGVRAAVFVGVTERPAVPVLGLVQVDDVAAADMADGLGKRRPAFFLGIRRAVQAESDNPERIAGRPFSFREHVDVGNGMWAQLVPLGRRRDVLLQRLVNAGFLEALEELR